MGKQVFLGGTCNESKWRDKIIQLLKIDYFNPVVEDWTPECLIEEYKQKEISEYLLYTITPKMTGVFSIAEIIDDSNKRPERTILCILEEDEGIKFDKGQLKSLFAVKDMAVKNGATTFDTLEGAAEYLNNERS